MRFGIEFELDETGSRATEEDVVRITQKAVQEAEFEHPVRTTESKLFWTVKSDDSCGYEITTPALTYNRKTLSQLRRFLKSLRSNLQYVFVCDCCEAPIPEKKIVSADTGMHVHVDVENLNKDALVRRFVEREPEMLRLVSPIRKNSQYVQLLSKLFHPKGGLTLEAKQESRGKKHLQDPGIHKIRRLSDNHYGAVNFTTFGTMEIRYSQGSLDPKHIFPYLRLIKDIVESARSKKQ